VIDKYFWNESKSLYFDYDAAREAEPVRERYFMVGWVRE
jgi:neutral trehalase